MLLRRIGNKAKIAHKIIEYFPEHTIYVEMFFGAGGMFFNKFPVSKYNILNDIDDEIFNLFQVLESEPKKLYRQIERMPYHQSLFKYLMKNQYTEPIKKAARFLYLSNYSYLGSASVIGMKASDNSKIDLLKNIKRTINYLNKTNVKFTNTDFREVFKIINYRHKEADKAHCFIYTDPPYLTTASNYNSTWSENDFTDLIDVLINSGIRFALSEFNTELIDRVAKDYNLNKHIVCERQTLKNRNTEILLTNYYQQHNLFQKVG